MNRTTPTHPAQDEAMNLIKREVDDIETDLRLEREVLSLTASKIGKLETRHRRMVRLLVMAGGDAA